MFDKLSAQYIVSQNTSYAGYVEYGLNKDVLGCLNKMQFEGLVSKFNERARKLHNDIVMTGLDGHSFIGSSLVDMYATCGLLVEAQKIFDLLPLRNVVTWTALIQGYAG